MCSSPKSNGCSIAPKKPTRSLLAGFSQAQRRAFADTANKAQERRDANNTGQRSSKRHQIPNIYEAAAASNKAVVKTPPKGRFVQAIWGWLMTYFQDTHATKRWADEHR